MTSIKQLRQCGYKVRVLHTRKYKPSQKIGGVYQELSNLGGYTKIELTTPEQMTVVGEAFCSDKENFNRHIGNQIALGRALGQLDS